MPHARHGGIAACSCAAAASKLVGNGLEYEQIGQTQVTICALATFGIVPCGLPPRGRGDEVALREGAYAEACVP